MNQKNISKKIETFLKPVKTGKGNILFSLQSTSYIPVIKSIISVMNTKLKLFGINVTLNKNYENLQQTLKQQKIDTSKILFIDVISQSKNMKRKNCIFITNPQSLTELSIQITEAVNGGKYEYVLIDSINTLLVYNDSNVIQKFIHFIINKLNALEIICIIISVKDESQTQKIFPTLMQFCDHVFDV